jgi:hypothetical protein
LSDSGPVKPETGAATGKISSHGIGAAFPRNRSTGDRAQSESKISASTL